MDDWEVIDAQLHRQLQAENEQLKKQVADLTKLTESLYRTIRDMMVNEFNISANNTVT
jgi:UDP-N-acetyl-D-mannosaminuronate dehydrogenase